VIHVEALSRQLEPAYTAFVERHPAALLYYSLPYRDLIAAHLECDVSYQVAIKDEQVVAVLPVMSMKGSFGHVLNSLPFFGSNGGVLAQDDQAAGALWRRWAELASDGSVASATVVGNPLVGDALPPVAFDLTDERLCQFLPLEAPAGTADGLEARLGSSVRWDLRKAESLGVRVVEDPMALPTLYELHAAALGATGGRAKPLEFFTQVPEHFRPGIDYRLFLAEFEGEAVAALLVFSFAGTVEYFTPATRLEHRNLQAGSLLIHAAMTRAIEDGCTRWNWGGTWPSQTGLLHFKRKWGGGELRYRYVTKVNARELMDATASELQHEYPDFYVLPYSALQANERQRDG
jgi:hypothetical protein